MRRRQPALSPGQLQLSRGMQLRILRDCQLPPAPHIRAAALRAVLRSIDDHAGGGVEAWPSQRTIARETSLGYRQVQRAVAVLVERSLLCVRSVPLSGGTGRRNHYRIVWTELALLCGSDSAEDAPRGAHSAADEDAPRGARVRALGDVGYAPRGAQEAPSTSPDSPTTAADVVVAVSAAGVSLAADVVAPCLARGCTAEQVLAVVTCHATRPDLGPGALHHAIALLQPGDAPNYRLPSLPAAQVAEQHRARRIADERQRADEERAEAERERAERQQLEQLHGDELDAMAGDELATIDTQVTGSDGQPLSAAALRMAPAAVLRERRLRVLAARTTA